MMWCLIASKILDRLAISIVISMYIVDVGRFPFRLIGGGTLDSTNMLTASFYLLPLGRITSDIANSIRTPR